MKKFVFVTILLILGLGFWFFNSTSTENVREFVITGADFDFTPSVINVEQGDKVRIIFKNIKGFHDFVIDEFDVATEPSQAPYEEVVEFTADKVGVFEYYCSVMSHRQMGMIGTLVVYEKGKSISQSQNPNLDFVVGETQDEAPSLESAEAIYEKCINQHAVGYKRVLCLLPYFEKLTISHDATYAIEEAKKLKASNIINDCHQPSHVVGRTNLRKLNYDLGKAFASCPEGCFEGCYHGSFEEYAEHIGEIDDLVTSGEVPEICVSLGEDRKLKLQCVHGIGHAMMRHQKTSEMIAKLDICNKITNLDYRTGCMDGVMMENVNSYLELSEDELKQALPKICEPIESSSKYKDLLWLCAQEISGGLIAYTADNLEKGKELCGVLSGELKDRCVSGLTESRKTFD